MEVKLHVDGVLSTRLRLNILRQKEWNQSSLDLSDRSRYFLLRYILLHFMQNVGKKTKRRVPFKMDAREKETLKTFGRVTPRIDSCS